LHLGGGRKGFELHALHDVLAAAARVRADAVILAGDVFDHNRLPLAPIEEATRALADAVLPVVILPGNHDPITPDSVYRRGGLADPANVRVFGVTDDARIPIDEIGLELWGKAHSEYVDMAPLIAPAPRTLPHQVVVAHGHWIKGPADMHRSWLIDDEEIAATGADYVALGHWELAQAAGDGRVPAWYSGSPDMSKTVNVVRIGEHGVRVERLPLGDPIADP
jgi:DNA repair exonuclease SbcCD nuclease subunit